MTHQVIVSLLLFWLHPAMAAGTIRGSFPLEHRQLTTYYEWAQVGESVIGESQDDNSGNSVAMNEAGDIIAIGARIADSVTQDTNAGHVRVFQLVEGAWTQMGSNIDGEDEADRSGFEVSLNKAGDIVAISARFNDGRGGIDSGHVRVYSYDSTAGDWIMMGTDDDILGSPLDGESVSAWLESVALSGDGKRVIIGASKFPFGSWVGEARVYDYNGASNEWNKVGQSLNGRRSGDHFGISLDISQDGSKVAIGAYGQDCDDNVNNNCGAFRVFSYEDAENEWVQVGNDTMGQGYKSEFGGDISLNGDGTIIAVGASRHSMYAGQVQVYKYDSGSDEWGQIGGDIDGEANFDRSGSSLSINSNGDMVAIGAWGNDNEAGRDSGHVRVFGYDTDADQWLQLGMDIDGESGSDAFGWSVAISGDGSRIVAGSPDREGEDKLTKGNARVFEYAKVTEQPSFAPTLMPSDSPSVVPTTAPSVTPTAAPSVAPSSIIRVISTEEPTSMPSMPAVEEPATLEACWVAIGNFFTALTERITKLQIDAGEAINNWS